MKNRTYFPLCTKPLSCKLSWQLPSSFLPSIVEATGVQGDGSGFSLGLGTAPSLRPGVGNGGSFLWPVDYNSQNPRASWLKRFWELKSTGRKVATVGPTHTHTLHKTFILKLLGRGKRADTSEGMKNINGRGGGNQSTGSPQLTTGCLRDRSKVQRTYLEVTDNPDPKSRSSSSNLWRSASGLHLWLFAEPCGHMTTFYLLNVYMLFISLIRWLWATLWQFCQKKKQKKTPPHSVPVFGKTGPIVNHWFT